MTTVADLTRLDAAVTGRAPGSLDCYVQLPVDVAPRGSGVIERVRNFLEDGLLARFAAVGTVLPALSRDGRVVLVAGSTLVDVSPPDDQGARLALLDVLADAVRADRAGSRLGVQVLPSGALADEVAAAALERTATGARADRAEPPSHAAEGASQDGESYDDWRVEVLGRISSEF